MNLIKDFLFLKSILNFQKFFKNFEIVERFKKKSTKNNEFSKGFFFFKSILNFQKFN